MARGAGRRATRKPGFRIFALALAMAVGCSAAMASPTFAHFTEDDTGPGGQRPDAERSAPPSPVAIHVSSAAGDRLAAKTSLQFGPAAQPGGRIVFSIDEANRLQQIDGFGASFLEAGLVSLNSLPGSDQQDAVLRALFDRQSGAGFSVMKTVIGSTDFQSASQRWYTYDDTPGDTSLSHFSIARDLGPDGLVTYIKRARQAGGDFKLQAPMDYPPDWMLYDLGSNQDVDPAYYQVLADYFVRYVQEYEKSGIHIDYVSPFNEPTVYTDISWTEIGDLIRNHVGPAFTAAGLSTGIQLGEAGYRASAAENYQAVLEDPAARKYISSLAYHGYDWTAWDELAALNAKYPDLPAWMTEICCAHDQSTETLFSSGDLWGNQIFNELEAGASAWIYWNAILDESGGPWLVSPIHSDPDPNAQDSVVVIDSENHTVTYTGLYYYLAHFSKFVRPGAHRIGTSPSPADGVRAISFQNEDASLVTELLNSGDAAAEVQLNWHGLSLQLTLPPTSITTLQWSA